MPMTDAEATLELDGQPITIEEANDLPEMRRREVVAVFPDGRRVRPWRFVGGPESVSVGDDGLLRVG